MHDLLISAINLKEAPPLPLPPLAPRTHSHSSGCKREDGRKRRPEEDEERRRKEGRGKEVRGSLKVRDR